MDKEVNSNSFNPRIWDHQRHVLINLKNVINDIFEHHIKLSPKNKIVDLGCGDKPYEPIFRKYSCEYVTCDLQGNVDILIQPGKPIPLPNEYADGVVSFQVLEHVWDLNWYLGNSYRILKKGGWILLSTHGNWPYHPHPTDYRRWTRDGVIKELEEQGFKVEKVISVVGPLAWMTQYCLLVIYKSLLCIPFLGKILYVPIGIFMNLLMILEDKITPKYISAVNACIYVALSWKKNNNI